MDVWLKVLACAVVLNLVQAGLVTREQYRHRRRLQSTVNVSLANETGELLDNRSLVVRVVAVGNVSWNRSNCTCPGMQHNSSVVAEPVNATTQLDNNTNVSGEQLSVLASDNMTVGAIGDASVAPGDAGMLAGVPATGAGGTQPAVDSNNGNPGDFTGHAALGQGASTTAKISTSAAKSGELHSETPANVEPHADKESRGNGWILGLVCVSVLAVLACAGLALGRCRNPPWSARRTTFRHDSDLQMTTNLNDWMAADDDDDVTIGGPLSGRGLGGRSMPRAKEVGTAYYDLSTPR